MTLKQRQAPWRLSASKFKSVATARGAPLTSAGNWILNRQFGYSFELRSLQPSLFGVETCTNMK